LANKKSKEEIKETGMTIVITWKVAFEVNTILESTKRNIL
jgi:hypothetical protein